jgi:hypothetical protein
MIIYRENSRQWAVGSEFWPIFIAGGDDLRHEHLSGKSSVGANLVFAQSVPVTPAKAGVQNMSRSRYGGTGLRLSLQ